MTELPAISSLVLSTRSSLLFQHCQHLLNPWNENKKVSAAKDGQVSCFDLVIKIFKFPVLCNGVRSVVIEQTLKRIEITIEILILILTLVALIIIIMQYTS